MTAALVLLPPPLRSGEGLEHLAAGPLGAGTALAPAVEGAEDEDGPPYAARYVARVSLELARLLDPGVPVVLAARGDAGPLAPAVAAAQRAAHRTVTGYVLVDALLPQPGTPTRAQMHRAQLPGEPVPEEGRPPGYTTEPLPMAVDWPDAPCGYLLTDPRYAPCARLARMRGWPVREAGGETARELAGLLEDLS